MQTVRAPVVLVVDDAPSLRLLCRVNFELEGYRVLEAATLAAARALLDREPVDVVLLDLHLGRERGDVLVDELRRREPRVPVAIVTGSAEIGPGAEGIDADARRPKPFTIDALRDPVRSRAPRAPIRS